MRGTDPFVEQVRLATDVLAVVSPYVELHRAGKRWKGLCPFHTEKTASFFVNQENQTYYCFGCQQGGDVFSFLMAQERMTFPEALRTLAERAGIPMPQSRYARDEADERIGEAMEVAEAFYRERLASADGRAAREYLDGRGIDASVADRFRIGWAPASWDALLRHAGRLLPERILLKAGLVVEGERGLYDRFRERVIIPIRTAGGRTVAFGGRLLGPGEPKYLNSPETPLYKKGSVLYGLPEAREAIRAHGDVIVVEGYFDAIGLSMAGIDWVVGTCGTAFTPEQANLLRRYTDRWTLLFDGDAAGRAAVLRALDAAVPVHPGVRVALCPMGEDPDTWVRKAGRQAVEAAFARAQTPLQFLEEWAHEARWTEEMTLARAGDLLRKVADPLIRDRWIQEAAGRFRIRERQILEAIGRPAGATARPAGAGAPGGAKPMPARERNVLGAAARFPALTGELREACEEIPGIAPRCLEILRWMEERHREGVVDEAGMLSRAAEEPALLRDLSFLHGEEAQAAEIPADMPRRLRRLALQHRMRELTDRIRRAEEKGEDIRQLVVEKQALASELRDIEAIEEGRHGNFPWTES